MIVYRLESPTGWGVFSTSYRRLTDDGTALYSSHACTLKSAQRDGAHRFACESIESLTEYWGTDFAYLLAQGYIVSVYKIRKNYVRFSPIPGLECAFIADKAERISEYEYKSDFRPIKPRSSGVVYKQTERWLNLEIYDASMCVGANRKLTSA